MEARSANPDSTGSAAQASLLSRNGRVAAEEGAVFFEQETTELPHFYAAQIRRDLGPLWEWLPPGAVTHDPNAYRESEESRQKADASPRPAPAGVSAFLT